MESDGRVWLITGAGRGFGNTFARHALEAGDRVVGTARSPEALQDLEQMAPERVLGLTLDVTDRTAAFDVAAKAVDCFGRIDVLVNNAGYSLQGALEELSEQEIRDEFDTNFFGVLWVSQAVIPVMRRQGRGQIINISSAAGGTGLPMAGMYCASKWALEGASEALAAELAPFGISVTIVQPSGFRTTFASSSHLRTDPIREYEETFADILERISPSIAGTEAGDPALAAQAILALADNPEPPLRLLLGNNAFDMLTAAHRRRLEEALSQESTARAADR
jgi:NAD(P)-dependent dehydrogenase (short-subunit alcohol dehydrogenase family)